MRLFLIFLSLFITYSGFSQPGAVSGKVSDAQTGQPLAFVSITANGGHQGCYSDIDGRFRLAIAEKIEFIRLSYLGYDPLEMKIKGNPNNLALKLSPTSIELSPVSIVPGLNPAHRIIKRVLENRDKNNPEKLGSFSYTAYEKTIITPNMDSLFLSDTTIRDTSLLSFKNTFSKQDVFIIESVYERKFSAPDKDNRKVLANRVSGLRDPIFTFLISQMQSNSFYKEVITISEKNYVNPISKGCFNKYYFHIEDTVFDDVKRDTTYIISYRPLLNRNFDGLRGSLYINTDGYAIQSVIASPARQESGISIHIQQLYKKVDSTHWFPFQLNTDLDINSIQINADSVRSFHLIGIGKTYLREIRINPELKRKDFNHVQLQVDPEASRRTDDYWNHYRQDSLSARDLRTYAFMDSLGRAEKLDDKLKFLESLATGKVPLWKIDLDLDKLVRYNPYEHWYLGLGISTNRRFSERMRLGAYAGYGFGDKTYKYGGEASYLLFPRYEAELGLSYKKDVFETGGIELFDLQKLNLYERFRNFLIDRMDNIESYRFALKFRTMKWCLVQTSLYRISKTPTYTYTFVPEEVNPPVDADPFVFTQWVTAIRFAYKEKFMKNARTQISLGTKYPVLQLQYSHGYKGMLDGQFEFDKIDFKIVQSFYTKYLGKTTLTLRGGQVSGRVPMTELYNGNGSFHQFTIFAMNSFATMRMNEFASDRYLAFYFHHSFGKLLVRTKYFEPEIAIATHITIGDLQHPEYHSNYTFKTMEKGYYESGLMLNKLISIGVTNMGFGAFYRYGPYAYKNVNDNISLKFSLVMPF